MCITKSLSEDTTKKKKPVKDNKQNECIENNQ